MRRFIPTVCLLLIATVGGQRLQTASVQVERVLDGDTIELASGERIRLFAVDAPEREQAGGDIARASLVLLVEGEVRLEHHGRSYGRMVAVVLVADQDVGLSLLGQGQVWLEERYLVESDRDTRNRYRAAYQSARDAHRGLWRDASACAPWVWRKLRRCP